jgi:hypothetical protein
MDADKIAAAILAAKLIDILPGAPDTAGKIANAISLYGDVLRQIAQISPATGKPFTQDELQLTRTLPRK